MIKTLWQKGVSHSVDGEPMALVCKRCLKPANPHIMSMYNEDIICMKCKDIEMKHPKYQDALEADIVEIKNGNYKFHGIGKPSDL